VKETEILNFIINCVLISILANLKMACWAEACWADTE